MDVSNSSNLNGLPQPDWLKRLAITLKTAFSGGKKFANTPCLKRLKTVLLFFGQALIILFITFALAEVTLRIYNGIKPQPIFYSTSYNRFRGKPFSPDYDGFHLNSRGFKDVEYSTESRRHISNIGNRRFFCLRQRALREQLPDAGERRTESRREARRAFKHGDS